MKMCVESVKAVPTHDKHTHVGIEVFILSTRQISCTIVIFYSVSYTGLNWNGVSERHTQNNLHIIMCDCSSMTRYLCVVCVRFFLFSFAAHRSVTQARNRNDAMNTDDFGDNLFFLYLVSLYRFLTHVFFCFRSISSQPSCRNISLK